MGHDLAGRGRPQSDAEGGCRLLVHFVAVRPPEHRVTLRVVDQDTGVPVDAVELRLGVFRATTNEAGIAQVEAPGGSYDITAWKLGHDIVSSSVVVAADMSIQLELAAAVDPEQPYWT